MRFHVVSVPQSCTTRAFSPCGFSQKTIRFCGMMKSLGHTVFLYGGEENEAECDQFITCINKAEQKELCGELPYIYPSWNPAHRVWRNYNFRVTAAINDRREQGDFVCVIGGNCQASLKDSLNGLKVVEYGIGYTGFFAKWKVWESHTWRAFMQGKHKPDDIPSQCDGVIHSFYGADEFKPAEKRGDFALFLGRVTKNKGVPWACEAAHRAGVKLIVAGFGDKKHVTHGAEYVGCVNDANRKALLAEARMVICPTQNFEPFGNVACEAQLSGTPVVCTDWGGFVETVQHGATGFRCNSLDEVADAVRNADALDRAYVRARALSMFSTDVQRHKYQSYFDRIARADG